MPVRVAAACLVCVALAACGSSSSAGSGVRLAPAARRECNHAAQRALTILRTAYGRLGHAAPATILGTAERRAAAIVSGSGVAALDRSARRLDALAGQVSAHGGSGLAPRALPAVGDAILSLSGTCG
jgi:hypothetical protein